MSTRDKLRSTREKLRHAVPTLAFLAIASVGCPSPMEPPPPEEPMIAAPEAPRIPWLAAGTPDIAPPQIPWLTDESACPEGWGWVEVAPGVNGCDPYPTGHVEDCGPTGAHFPGEAGCRDLDSGDTEWPSDLPATNVLYVREGASGGDGTRELPFATLPEALAAAVEGTTIALAPGRYDTGQGAEIATNPGVFDTLSDIAIDGVHLRGTSVARTTLYSSRPPPPPMGGDIGMLTVRSRDVEISDLRFEGPHPAIAATLGSVVVSRVVLDGTFLGLFLSNGCTAVLEDVIARANTGSSLVAAHTGANVTLRRAVSQGSAEITVLSDGMGSSMTVDGLAVIDGGPALVAGGGGVIDATHIAVIAPTVTSIAASGGRLHARWMSVDRIPSTVTGLIAQTGGTLEAEDLVMRGSPGVTSMVGNQAGSSLTVSRAVLDGGQAAVFEGVAVLDDVVCHTDGPQLEARGTGSGLTLSRVQMSGLGVGELNLGLFAQDGTTITASNLSLRDLGGEVAFGVYAVDAAVTIERASFDGMQAGAFAYEGGEISLTDVAIRDMRVISADWSTGGIVAVGSTVNATRVSIERVEGDGVIAFEPGHAVHLEDVSIREVRGAPGFSRGIGIFRDGEASSLTRVEIADSRGLGLVAGSSTEISDLFVHDIDVDSDGSYGFGVSASGPMITAHRVVIRDVATSGLVSARPAGRSHRWDASDVRIERVGHEMAGAAVVVGGDVDTSLTRFVLRDAASVGLYAHRGARVMLTDGLIASAPSCTTSESMLDLSSVRTDACGAGPTTWVPEP